MRGRGAALAAMLNEGGPWGGDKPGGGKSGGDSGGSGGGPRNPWNMPPDGGKPVRGRGPSAIDALYKRARVGFGGGGGGLPSIGWPVWGYAALGLALLWIAVTCVHRINPQERGVVTRLGKYSRTLDPGVSITFPAPIDRVQTIDVQNIRTINIPEGAGEKLVLTGDQNIIDLDYSVRWNIKSPELYLFQLADPDATITAVAESALRAAVANVSLNDAIGSGRTGIEAEVAQRMQLLLDRYRAGVRIQGVAIKRADPPDAVNDAFKAVSAAQQEAQTSINQARAYAQQIIAKAQGDAASFDRVYVQYKLAPEVTRRRMYYETMEEVLAKVDKTIVEPGGVNSYLPLGNGARTTPPAAQTGGQQ
ncbi:MAG: FtsH protease activity modulator HflK [Sphingomonadaceae bacterium]|nr:FtsH protease activity modulator HflK [Sphingomonadaceae bacterium]